MADHVPTGKTFNITTIAELSAVATESNIDFLLADLKLCLEGAIALNKMHTAIIPDGNPMPLKDFIWTDDGITVMTEMRLIDENGKTQFTIDKESFNQSPEQGN